MKIDVSYKEELYHFIWFKGIVEILMGFVILWFVRFNNFDIIFGTIICLLLIYSGVNDLKYFIRLKNAKDKQGEKE